MKIENLKIMSIGSNCATINLLGTFREKGPIDNCALSRGLEGTSLLFDNKLLDLIKNKEPVQRPRKPSFTNDNNIEYNYGPIKVVHNNPLEEKYKVEIEKRYNNFLNFFENVKSKDNYYFAYSLSAYDITPDRCASNLFKKSLNILKTNGVLNKTIFIGTHWDGTYWNFYMKDHESLGINYVEIPNFNMWKKPYSEKLFKETLEKANF